MEFPAEAAKCTLRTDVFLTGADLTPLRNSIDRIVEGLVSWKPRAVKKTPDVAPPVIVEGRDYRDALAKMNLLFLKQKWSDGLPILPATEERVERLLTGSPFPRNTVIGKILPRNGIANVESIAIAAAMAGCRPEYMPILTAALQAILDPVFYHQHMQTSTGDAYPALIVNGPVARQIRLNSNYGCLGPSSEYPAGASIGRAIRFLLMNVGGAVPGVGAMALYGGPARYTGLVFSEDEEGLPFDWEPLNVERGFAKGSSTVSALSASGTTCVWEGAALGEKEIVRSLDNFAGYMAVPNGGYFAPTFCLEGTPGALLIGRTTARGLSDAGWSKQKVKTYLWERARLPESDWLRETLHHFSVKRELPVRDYIQYPMPIAVGPENIMIVVAGGAQSGHSYWLQVHGGTHGPVTKGVSLPPTWEQLLDTAEKELGPPPASA